MVDFKEIERVGNAAVERLRIDKLSKGIPFMIYAEDLPSTQCYLEYPDGHISIVSICPDKIDFKIIRDLTIKETRLLRKEFDLTEVYA